MKAEVIAELYARKTNAVREIIASGEGEFSIVRYTHDDGTVETVCVILFSDNKIILEVSNVK